MQYILGIETSCDETAAAVVTGEGEILSNVIASQMDIHAAFGGVVPEIAARNHVGIIDKVVEQALSKANISASQVTHVAATVEPGLPGAVMIGRVFARSLATALGVPFIPVNHVHGHIASVRATQGLPHLALVVSGGHTSLFEVNAGAGAAPLLLEQTLDDAVGEAFDKVARVLGIGFPGGPAIEKLAREYQGTDTIQFVKQPNYRTHGFSYSGLKTAVINYLHRRGAAPAPDELRQICHSFQVEAFGQIIHKLRKYLCKGGNLAPVLGVSGGVAINKYFQQLLRREFPGAEIHFPPNELCGDNAAMIAMSAIAATL